jgi:UDP-2,3-diacylglucosamine hydrolase
MERDAAWCLADPHFGREDGAIPSFHRWLDLFLRSEARHLVLLGDLFEVWVGPREALTPAQAGVLEALARTAEARPVTYLAGNRDYLVAEEVARLGISVREALRLSAGGRRFHFEHGDLINTSDRPYLAFREVARSAAARAFVGALPPRWAARLGLFLEGRLSGTNRVFKRYEPVRELERWAEDLKAHGVDEAVVGHFHRSGTVRSGGLVVRFVPQFREEGFHLRIGPGGTARLFDLGGGGPVEVPQDLLRPGETSVNPAVP